MLCTVGLAAVGLAVATEVLSHLRNPAVVTNSEPMVNGWAALAFIGDIRAGVTEETIIVAIPVLVGVRAGWSPAWIVALSVAFRWPFHIYHGLWSSLPWAMIWGGSFAAAFVLWRRLLPLIVLHAVYDSANTAGSIGGAGWRAAVYCGALLFFVFTFIVGLYRQRRQALDVRFPRLNDSELRRFYFSTSRPQLLRMLAAAVFLLTLAGIALSILGLETAPAVGLGVALLIAVATASFAWAILLTVTTAVAFRDPGGRLIGLATWHVGEDGWAYLDSVLGNTDLIDVLRQLTYHGYQVKVNAATDSGKQLMSKGLSSHGRVYRHVQVTNMSTFSAA